jgi:glycosyltransferase involved in cell wall biosynthesis
MFQIDDRNEGFILLDDPVILADTNRELANNPNKLKNTARLARERFEKHYTIEHIVPEYHSLYEVQSGTH